jgi:hypothetical protein
MRISSLVLVLGSLLSVACASDAEVICKKLDECNMLTNQSVDDCTSKVEKAGTDAERSDCADCMDDKSCSTIHNGGCLAECVSLVN